MTLSISSPVVLRTLAAAAAAMLLLSGPDASTGAPGPEGPPTLRDLESPPAVWGAEGHRMAARAALEGLPPDMPAFFRERGDQLVYLNPEPDRWRDEAFETMDEAFTYDHYIDLENVPGPAFEAPDRWRYLEALFEAGLDEPQRDGGFLPFRIVELYQRIVLEWRLWRTTEDSARRRWIEDRLVNDAGLLGHYVTDASQPHHTTIHFNGWASRTPNPEGFSRSRDIHYRFESAFVDAHVEYDDVRAAAGGGVRDLGDVPAAVRAMIVRSNDQVERLYVLERDVGFDPERADPRTVGFATERLAAGAAMLRDLWWTAWLESGR